MSSETTIDPRHGWVTPRGDGARAKCMGPPACPGCAAELAELEAAAPAAEPTAAEAERNGLYTERAHLAALATTLFPSWVEVDPLDPGWPVVHILTPYGLVGWHIAPTDVHLFDHVTRGGGPGYDGHTKREALERLELATAARASATCERVERVTEAPAAAQGPPPADVMDAADLARYLAKWEDTLSRVADYLMKSSEAEAAKHCNPKVFYSPICSRVQEALAEVRRIAGPAS